MNQIVQLAECFSCVLQINILLKPVFNKYGSLKSTQCHLLLLTGETVKNGNYTVKIKMSNNLLRKMQVVHCQNEHLKGHIPIFVGKFI